VTGHGRLMEPPARNSMWRFGFINPINYNDNEVFCGGADTQFNKNGGRCGICGDAYDEAKPRHHESEGLYGNKVITKTYVMNSVIDLEVEITANHKGRFTFKACPLEDNTIEATQSCLDKYPLTQLDGEPEFPIHVKDHNVIITKKAKLPQGLHCSRCVLQWTWTSANSWGICENGTQGLGCGPQETFRNCADIRIVTNADLLPATDNPRAIIIRDPKAKNEMRVLVVRSQVCIATHAWKSYGSSINTWCQQNCLAYPPNCPADICMCPDTCSADAGSELDDFECNKRCLRYPSTELCPKSCSCSAQPGLDFASLDAVVVDAKLIPNSNVVAKSRDGHSGQSYTQTFLSWIPRIKGLLRLQTP